MAEDFPDLGLGQTLRSFAAGQKVFGRYTLAKILGRGGMGVVWLARDEQLEVDVALKFLPELLALDPGAIDDMKRETRRSRELSHRNIVKVYHFEQDQELAAISMEHVDGASLAKLKVDQRGKCFSHTQLAPWLLELADALDYAHSEGKMVHRDLKPANVMLNSRNRIKITDFGIASSIADSVSQLSVGRGSSGTPPYMSPQQASGNAATPADDIYSVGATIYDLITGKPPFYSGNIHHQVENIVPPSMAERRAALGNLGEPIPDNWEQTIAACLAKDPAQRVTSAVEVAERLGLKTSPTRQTAVAAAERPPQKKALAWVLGTALVLLLAAVGYYFASQRGAKTASVSDKTQPVESAAPSPSASASPTSSTAPALAEATPQPAAPAASPSATIETTGTVTVTTEPPGASVAIGDKSGKTPVTLSGIPAGKQKLKVELDGYQTLERDVAVREGETVDAGDLRLERIQTMPESSASPVAALPRAATTATAIPVVKANLNNGEKALLGTWEIQPGSGTITFYLTPEGHLGARGSFRKSGTVPPMFGTDGCTYRHSGTVTGIKMKEKKGKYLSGTLTGSFEWAEHPKTPHKFDNLLKEAGKTSTAELMLLSTSRLMLTPEDTSPPILCSGYSAPTFNKTK